MRITIGTTGQLPVKRHKRGDAHLSVTLLVPTRKRTGIWLRY